MDNECNVVRESGEVVNEGVEGGMAVELKRRELRRPGLLSRSPRRKFGHRTWYEGLTGGVHEPHISKNVYLP